MNMADHLIRTSMIVALGAGTSLLPSLSRGDDQPPVDQGTLNALAVDAPEVAFLAAFEAGDELTEMVFTTARGVGANVREGQRFTRFPRADLDGPGEWANHQPPREGGPQAQSCISCHALPYANGAGGVELNVAIDPLQTGDPRSYLERNTAPLFSLGAIQRVAEEMTTELQAQEAALAERACTGRAPIVVPLTAKGVGFGTLTATPEIDGEACTPRIDRSKVAGVNEDLVVRAFGWKGTHPTIRSFARDAANNEMGLQADELVGATDGDHDGYVSELTVGDLTALTIYMAALERPTSMTELAALGLVELSPMERSLIAAGEARFHEVGCAGCHKPEMLIEDPVFTEPSLHPAFAEPVLPSGATAAELGLSPETAIRFDLTADLPNNRVVLPDGRVAELGAYETDAQGRAVVRRYSDFRRHEMGQELADPVDAYGIGASVWPTRGLAGVGSTGPWLHDGRATTLDEAILAHGGEAAASRDRYAALSDVGRAQVVSFLANLVIVDLDPEDEEH